ncbi:VWA domain-containing protein [Thermodesulfobacteriota bacterium]
MEQILQNLIIALRNSGVRISLSESIEAMQAVKLVGYRDRLILKDALSASLAKSQGEKEIFEGCFERFYSNDPVAVPEDDSPAEPDEEDSLLTRYLLEGDTAALSMGMKQAAEEVDIKGIWFFTQKGYYIRRILNAMGAEGLDRDISRLLQREERAERKKADALVKARTLLFENVRDFVEKQYALFAGTATDEILERYLREARLSNLEQRDFQRMHVIIQKMVKRLNDLFSKRKKMSNKGHLDLRKTIRANLAYQGILFDPKWKNKKIDRPEIVALCDVSRSVETVARFMLLFLYGLNEEVAKVRSFIFCSNLVEASRIFDEYQVEEALVRLQQGTGLGIHMGSTDYGQVFMDFKKEWLDTISNKTTVIILGDARNNFGDPQTGILKLIHERSKRLIWLNPEPPTFWGTGDSEMMRYKPYCYLCRECSTVNHLERAVAFLLRTQG